MHANNQIYHINKTFPSIDRLEYFPTEILMPIFVGVDDNGLLSISSVNDRFKAIAQTVFKKRYANKYFTIECGKHEEQYVELFKVFGDGIKAIDVINIENIGRNHWLTEMLKANSCDLDKISLNNCYFNNAFDFLSHYLQLTELIIRSSSDNDLIHLPKYQHLKKLEIDCCCLNKKWLKSTIACNPQLECLKLRMCDAITLPDIMRFVSGHLKSLKDLSILEPFDFEEDIPTDSLIKDFVNSIRNLESLEMAIDTQIMGLLRRLSSKCKHIKRLKLQHMSQNIDGDMVREFRKLDKIKHLTLQQQSYDGQIELLVGHLSQLQYLNIIIESQITLDEILSLFRNCASLETVKIDQCYNTPIAYASINFYNEWKHIASNPNAKIEFIDRSQIIGIVTKNEVVWRNKLMHWNGYDPVYNHSNLYLLDLANVCQESNMKTNPPFEQILDYLDLCSLYSLSRTSRTSKQLVECYMRQASREQHKFVITDEFQINNDGLRAFGPYVNNLVVCIERSNNLDELQSTIGQYYHLRKLCLQSYTYIDVHDFIFPQVRHMIYYHESCITICNVYKISAACPDLEILELKTPVDFDEEDSDTFPKHFFHNLKRISFRPVFVEHDTYIRELFSGTTTDVIIENPKHFKKIKCNSPLYDD